LIFVISVTGITTDHPTPDERGSRETNTQRWYHGNVHPLNMTADWLREAFRRYGRPFIGLANSRLPDYNWNTVAVSSHGRLERMRILCDLKHLIEDSVYALFAEMIRSACIDQAYIAGQSHEKDTHPFHLPKQRAVKHFFRLSVSTSTMGRQCHWSKPRFQP
jgi:hypothetical protein